MHGTMMKSMSMATTIVFLLSSCAHHVSLNSKPQGAKIHINDEYIGETPCQFKERTGSGKSYFFRIEKEGFKPVVQSISQTDVHTGVVVGSVLGGLLILIPYIGLIWMMKLKDNYYFQLEPIHSDQGHHQDKGMIEKRAEKKFTGTGFAISPNGTIATAYHVISNATNIIVHFSDGPSVNANVVQIDPNNDLAILNTSMKTPAYLSLAPVRTAKTGDHVFTMGFPMSSILGQEAKYSDGSISSLTGFQNYASFMQITVPVQPGNSGGPLLNEMGYVVGVITSSIAIEPFIKETGTLPQNINWAVKADYLRPIIDLPEQLPPTQTRGQAVEMAKKAIVFIECGLAQ